MVLPAPEFCHRFVDTLRVIQYLKFIRIKSFFEKDLAGETDE
jgi:hypothetical protein